MCLLAVRTSNTYTRMQFLCQPTSLLEESKLQVVLKELNFLVNRVSPVMLKLVFLYWYNSVGKRFSVISYSFQGILVAKKKLFKNKIPDNCGGGTVFYVRDLLSHYANNRVVIHNKLHVISLKTVISFKTVKIGGIKLFIIFMATV